MGAILSQVYMKELEKKLYPTDLNFVNFAKNHDPFVSNKTVRVPQSGTISDVEEDRAVFPITVEERTDTELTYDMIRMDAGVVRVEEFENFQANYPYRDSILEQQADKLNARIGDRALHEWAVDSGSRIIRTTGTATANIAPPSGTGNRNAMTLSDLTRMNALLDEDDLPSGGNRILVVPARMWNNFVDEELDRVTRKDYMGSAKLMDGAVDVVLGWQIFIRSRVVVYSAGATLKALGAAAATDDNFGAVGYHTSAVARAKGSSIVKVEDSAVYSAWLLHTKTLFGASKLRTDEKGVVSLAQA